MITILKKNIALLDKHTLEVIKKSSASIIVKVIGMVVSLSVSVFLGRTIGAEGLGIINLANSIVSLLLVLTMFGFDNVLIKYIAIAFENKNNQKIADSIFTSSVFNGLLAFSISITGILATPYLVEYVFKEPQLKIPLSIALVMVVPQTYSRIFAAGLSGFRKIWQSALVNETLSIWVVGLGLILLYFLKISVDIEIVAIVYAIGRITVTTVILIYWKNLFIFEGRAQWNFKQMFKMAKPMLLVAATSIIAANTSIIMLGWLENSKEVGLYSVAARIALLTSFFLQVSNAAISPKLAALYANKKIEDISIMVHHVTRGLVFVAILSLFFFIVGGHVISGIWGEDFKDIYWILVILGVGQFFNISTGCAGLLLIMCGYEKLHGNISVFSVLLNLVLNFFLILTMGITGAAISTAITVGGENIVKLFFVHKKIGISMINIPIVRN